MQINEITSYNINELQVSEIVIKQFESPSKILVILKDKISDYKNIAIQINRFYCTRTEDFKINKYIVKDNIYCVYSHLVGFLLQRKNYQK